MDKLTRNQSSIIFQTRTRMLKVKENYKNKYKTHMKCPACGQQTAGFPAISSDKNPTFPEFSSQFFPDFP